MPMSIVSEKSRKNVLVCVQIKNSQRAGQDKTGSKLRSKSFTIFDVGIAPRLRLKLALKCNLPLLPRNFSKITWSACCIQFIAYFIIIRETSKIMTLHLCDYLLKTFQMKTAYYSLPPICNSFFFILRLLTLKIGE